MTITTNTIICMNVETNYSRGYLDSRFFVEIRNAKITTFCRRFYFKSAEKKAKGFIYILEKIQENLMDNSININEEEILSIIESNSRKKNYYSILDDYIERCTAA